MSIKPNEHVSELADLPEFLENRHEHLRNEIEDADDTPAIGYMYDYVPREIIEAAGCIPVKVSPYESDVTLQATREHIQTSFTCGFVNATFEEILQEKFDFLNGLITGHACTPLQRMHEQIAYLSLFDFMHYVKAPTKLDSTEFYAEELKRLSNSLENHLGSTINPIKITDAIEQSEEVLNLLDELYEFRTTNPPKLSGREAFQAAFAVQLLPAKSSQELLRILLQATQDRSRTFDGERVFVTGCSTYRTDLIQLIENQGAVVIADDSQEGGRLLARPREGPEPGLNQPDDPYKRLARTYLGKPGGSYKADFDRRLTFIENQLDKHNIDSVITLTPKFCDPYMLRIESIRDLVESTGRNFLALNHEHSLSDEGQLRLRVQSFLEN